MHNAFTIIKNGVGMRAPCYIFIDNKNPQHQHELDDEAMQEFLINNPEVEGVLYDKEFPNIHILYNIKEGYVKMVGREKNQSINTDFTSAFAVQRGQVETAIRRVVKLELLFELYKIGDESVCGLIKQHHAIDPASGKVCSHTSETELDMTLFQVIKLGYPHPPSMLLLHVFFHGESATNQTQLHKAIYEAFEEFKKLYKCSGSHSLEPFKSKNAVQEFMKLIVQHVNSDKIQSHFYKKGSG